METAIPDIRQIEANAWKIRSASHPSTSHTVRLAYRKWWRTCPATVAECRHVRRAKEMLTMGHTAPVPVQDPDDDYTDACP